ncbi:hypothetical protein [Sphingomonas agri]|uniref:hypothetical protein n=1 Tax=Sphingomonas agri TaxID=1813878 RepID=UPI00311D8191
MDDDDRLERVLHGFDDAVIEANDEELGAPDEGVGKLIAGALKAYGFDRDGSRVRTSWKRARRGRPRPVARSPVSASHSETPLRATFSCDRHDEDDDDPEGSKT